MDNSDKLLTGKGLAQVASIIKGELENKVNKETGKGLSENDFTTLLKEKLADIADGAEVNVQSDWNATSGDAFIKNKPSFDSISNTEIEELINRMV